LVKREVFRPTGARLAEAALAVPPGALFYRLTVGGQQVGYSSTTIDTLASSLRVENVFVLDVPAMGTLHRTSARSIAMLSRALRLNGRDVTARVAAESTLVVSDSADLDSTTMAWVPEHFDTVRAFRIDHDALGVPMSSWIDAQGGLVFATTDGFAMERAAFEIVYQNFKKRDTVRIARSSAAPAPGEIVPLTALVAGVRVDQPPPRDRLRLRKNGRDT